MTRRKKVIIVGAGLAGLSAAVYLIKKGFFIHVVEAKPYIGGRTASWEADGMVVESGLHRFLGFYEILPRLLHQVGVQVDDVVQWVNELEIRLPNPGPSQILTLSPLGQPVDTLRSLLGNNDFLSASEKLALSNFMVKGLKEYFSSPASLDEVSIYEFATREGLSQDIIKKIITPFSTGLFFLPPEGYSSYVFFGTIGPYLKRIHQLKIGAFRGGMTEVMIEPIVDFITKQGGRVDSEREVTQLLFDGKKVRGVRLSYEEIVADEVILAASLAGAKTIIRQTPGLKRHFPELLALPTMPAVTVQFELSEPSANTDRVVFSPDTLWASYAEQARTTFTHLPGRLSAIMAKADELIYLSDSEILEKALEDAKEININLKTMTNYRVIRHPADFYSLSPGSEKLRPPQATSLPGLTLAGDYTKQKYLATMEGAVDSGEKAANILNRENTL
ncbi:MAG: hydroxysqualene dehydroxylase [Patescibacteria group bacterium]